MIRWYLFMLLAAAQNILTASQEGTVFQETCQFGTFDFTYLIDSNDKVDVTSINKTKTEFLGKLKTFIAEEKECAKTMEAFQDPKYTRETRDDVEDQFIVAVTFIVFPQVNLTDMIERQNKPIFCRDRITEKTNDNQARVISLIPLNISGNTRHADFVRMSNLLSCCEKLYDLTPNQCCRPGFVKDKEKCACPAGTFLQRNLTKCSPCPKDTYQPELASTECISCPASTTTYTTTGATALSQCKRACSQGKRFVLSSKNCTDCPRNTYQPLEGQLQCIPCQNNTITNSTGKTSPKDCAQFCNPGSFYDFNTASCEFCSLNTYQPNGGQFSCVRCNPGRITLKNGSKNEQDCILECPPGSAFNKTIRDCQQCPLGFFQPQSGKTECIRCPDDKITVNVSSTRLQDCIENCPPGTAYNYTTKACQDCPFHSFQPKFGKTECLPCPDAKITINVSSSRLQDCIKNCTPGYAFDYETQDCQNCSLNSFQPESGKTECIPCPNGTITIDASSLRLEDCIKKCPPGSAFNHTTKNCQVCPLNFFQSQSGKTQCIRCPDGKITMNTSSSKLLDCIKDCPPGSAFNTTLQVCQKCPLNTFQSKSGKTDCIPCPDGKITINISSSNEQDCITNCPAGSAFNYTTQDCQKCPVNSFQPQPGKIKCISCTAGKITKTTGTIVSEDCITECDPGLTYDRIGMKCDPCPLNTYKPTKGDTECIKCPSGRITYHEINTKENDCGEECKPGEYFNITLWSCFKCPRNSTQDNKGEIECKECPNGDITEEEGAVSANDCIKICGSGEYYDKNQFTCLPCDENYYQPNPGKSKCIRCPDGKITFSQGSSSVDECVKACPPGTHHVNRTSNCTPCSSDSYQDKSGKTSCNVCFEEKKTIKLGSTREEDCLEVCRPGWFHDNSTRKCVECPKNTYQPLAQQFSCRPCPNGTVTVRKMRTSNDSCIQDCNKGFFHHDISKPCLPCPRGTFKPHKGPGECRLCTFGLTTERTGSIHESSCIPDCKKGSYYDSKSDACQLCPRGEYQPQSGQAHCLKCLSNQTTLDSGKVNSDACYLDCKKGSYYNSTLDSCVLCPRGQFQPSSGQISCKKCLSILTTYKIGTVEENACIINCEAGNYYNITFEKCFACPLNTYQDHNAATSCKRCPNNTVTEEIGTKSKDGCLLVSRTSRVSLSRVVTIATPIIVAFVVLLILLVVLYQRRKKLNDGSSPSSSTRRLQPNTSSLTDGSSIEERPKLDSVVSNHHYKLEGSGLKSDVARPNARTVVLSEDLEIPRECLKFEGVVLGKGNFGRVERARLFRDGEETIVAVKMIKGGGSFTDEKELFDELEILASLHPHPHENIVNLIGGCTSDDGPLFVTVEYCSNGNLLKYLQRHQTQTRAEYVNIIPKAPKPAIPYVWKLNKALEICSGMAHLAKHKVIHRDVAARNVLLDSNWVAKISDFGMARDIYVQQIYRKDTEGFLPVRWMAIESLESFIYTSQSDVWSFGILLWEIITDGRVPYNNIFDHNQLLAYIKSGRIMKRPKNCPKDYYHMMEKCWAMEPSNRPSFEKLVRDIQILYDQELRKDEALPQRIFRKFSSRRKRKKAEEDGESHEGKPTGLARTKSRIRKTLSNTSGKKIDRIEEEQLTSGKEDSGGNVIKMRDLEASTRDETVDENNVNKGYDTSASEETKNSSELDDIEKTTREKELSTDAFNPEDENEDNPSENEPKESDKDAGKLDSPEGKQAGNSRSGNSRSDNIDDSIVALSHTSSFEHDDRTVEYKTTTTGGDSDADSEKLTDEIEARRVPLASAEESDIDSSSIDDSSAQLQKEHEPSKSSEC